MILIHLVHTYRVDLLNRTTCEYISIYIYYINHMNLIKWTQVCDKSIEYFSNELEIISRHIQSENNIDLQRFLVDLIKKMREI